MTQTITITLAPTTVPDTFATVAAVAGFLQVTIATGVQQAACERALAEATEAIRNYCHQYISEVEDDEITLDCAGGSRLFLPELPVSEVAEVVEDGETLTAGAEEDYQLGDHGVLHRVGQEWAKGIQILKVTYTHGYATLPDDIVAVCVRAASRGYQAGLAAAGVGGVPGVASVGLGDFQAGFTSGQGGGVGEGVAGASAARILLLSEKDTLNRYRYVRQ